MKSQGEHLKGIFFNGLIIFAHIHKHSFLVGELLVLVYPVVQFQGENDLVDLRLGRLAHRVIWLQLGELLG